MLRDLQKFWKAFGSSEEMACCYQLLYMMVIQNAQPGLEIPALVRGTPCPARFPVGADLAGAAAAAMCCGASAAVQSLVQAALHYLPWYRSSPWMCLPSLLPFPHQVPRGSSWGVYSCLGLLQSLLISINLGKLQKLRVGVIYMGIIPS